MPSHKHLVKYEDLSLQVEIAKQIFDYNYYVINGHYNKSWLEVDKFCKSLGGYLPNVVTESDRQLITRLLLGDIFAPNKTKVNVRCRIISASCGVFVGLRKVQVSSV